MGGSLPAMAIDLVSTYRGSLMEGFLPAGWDLTKIRADFLESAEFTLNG